MADRTDIEGALNKKLTDDFPDIEIAFENQGDADGGAKDLEDLGKTHFEVFFLPATPTVLEVGSTPTERKVGVYQVTVRTPLYQGKYESNTLVNRLATSFKIGTRLALNGVNVTITRSAYPTQGSRNGSFYEVPVTIDWLSDS